MKVHLAYGREGLEIDLADDWNVQVLSPAYTPGLADPAGAVREALRHPISSQPLRERARASDVVGIVVNDITRATPYRVLLPVLLAELDHVADDRIVFFVATGTHRSNTIDELNAMLGEDIVRRFRIVQNDAKDRDSHAPAGTTRSGNAVWIHKELLNVRSANSHRVHRAALLRGLFRRGQGLHARHGPAGDGPAKSLPGEYRPSEGDLGRHAREPDIRGDPGGGPDVRAELSS